MLPATIILILAVQGQASAISVDGEVRTRTDQDRGGVYHADIVGTVVAADDALISGATVFLWTRVQQLRFAARPIASSTTDEHGRFEFADVTSPDPLVMTITATSNHLEETRVIDVVSGRFNELGPIKLDWNTTIRGTIETRRDGETMPVEDLYSVKLVVPEVATYAHGGQLVLGSCKGGEFQLDQINVTETVLQIAERSSGTTKVFHAPITIIPGERDRYLHVTLLADLQSQQDRESTTPTLEYWEETRPPLTPWERTVRGVLRAVDGTPLQGWDVQLGTWWTHVTPGSTVTTQKDGTFDVRFPRAEARRLWIRSPGGSAAYNHALGGQTPTQQTSLSNQKLWADFDESLDLILPRTQQLDVHVLNGPTGNVRVSFWQGTHWQLLDRSAPWVWIPDYGTLKKFRAEIAGVLPVVQEARIPGFNEGRVLDPSESIPITIRFPELESRTLRVVSSETGEPVAEAAVDVLTVNPWPQRKGGPGLVLATGVTDATGEIRRQADPNALYELYVYGHGYEPKRALWVPPSTTVSVQPLDAAVVAELKEGYRLRIKPTGSAVPAAVMHAGDLEPSMLAAGTYDWALLDSQGNPVRGNTFDLANGETVSIDEASDGRARITLQLPESTEGEEWQVWVSRSSAAGGVSGAMASSSAGGAFSAGEPVAKVEQINDHEFSLVLTGMGPHVVHCSSRSIPAILSHELVIKPKMDTQLVLPPLTASLRGSMQTYDAGSGFSQHGTAGPRLVMVAMKNQSDHTPWNATVSLPKRVEEGGHEFLLTSLPPGSYHLYQHLIGENLTYFRDGKPKTRVSTAHAWGGIPVELKENRETIVPDFAEFPLGSVDVQVIDSENRTLQQATLTLRDRMWESWKRISDGGSTVRYANDPIPSAPRRRLEEGNARFLSVREGPAEWVVTTDSGRTFSCTRWIDFDCVLEIRVPWAEDLSQNPTRLDTNRDEPFEIRPFGRGFACDLGPGGKVPDSSVGQPSLALRVESSINDLRQIVFILSVTHVLRGLDTDQKPQPSISAVEFSLTGETVGLIPLELNKINEFAGSRITFTYKAIIPPETLKLLIGNSSAMANFVGAKNDDHLVPSFAIDGRISSTLREIYDLFEGAH